MRRFYEGSNHTKRQRFQTVQPFKWRQRSRSRLLQRPETSPTTRRHHGNSAHAPVLNDGFWPKPNSRHDGDDDSSCLNYCFHATTSVCEKQKNASAWRHQDRQVAAIPARSERVAKPYFKAFSAKLDCNIASA